MKLDAEMNEAGAAAAELTTRWAKLKDHQALAELMHDATRLQIDPRNGHMLGEVRCQHAELKRRYDALLTESKSVFNEAAASYEKRVQPRKGADPAAALVCASIIAAR